MQVQKCSTPAPKAVEKVLLSWEEIQTKEGVYKLKRSAGERWVVLIEDNGKTAVLYYAGSRLVPSVGGYDSTKQFERVDKAVVCFEIKE